MTINIKAKNIVTEDWKNAFPQLTLFEKNKLYKVVGPLVMGLELIKLPRTEDYRPHFVLYSLCGTNFGTDLKSCLASPILLMEYHDDKGFQFSIPYEKHSLFFSDVVSKVKEQTLLPFEGPVSIEKVFNVLDGYAKTSSLRAAPNSYLQANLQATKLKIALFTRNKKAEILLKKINERVWDRNSFKMWNVDLEKWLLKLNEMKNNMDDLIKQAESNINETKIMQLNSSELVG